MQISNFQMQIWVSAIVGFLCPTALFGASLASDLKANVFQCAIGSATKLFDKLSSIYGFIIAAFVIREFISRRSPSLI